MGAPASAGFAPASPAPAIKTPAVKSTPAPVTPNTPQVSQNISSTPVNHTPSPTQATPMKVGSIYESVSKKAFFNPSARGITSVQAGKIPNLEAPVQTGMAAEHIGSGKSLFSKPKVASLSEVLQKKALLGFNPASAAAATAAKAKSYMGLGKYLPDARTIRSASKGSQIGMGLGTVLGGIKGLVDPGQDAEGHNNSSIWGGITGAVSGGITGLAAGGAIGGLHHATMEAPGLAEKLKSLQATRAGRVSPKISPTAVAQAPVQPSAQPFNGIPIPDSFKGKEASYHESFVDGVIDTLADFEKAGFAVDPNILSGIGTGALVGGGIGAASGIMDSSHNKDQTLWNAVKGGLTGAAIGGGVGGTGAYLMPHGPIAAGTQTFLQPFMSTAGTAKDLGSGIWQGVKDTAQQVIQ